MFVCRVNSFTIEVNFIKSETTVELAVFRVISNCVNPD